MRWFSVSWAWSEDVKRLPLEARLYGHACIGENDVEVYVSEKRWETVVTIKNPRSDVTFHISANNPEDMEWLALKILEGCRKERERILRALEEQEGARILREEMEEANEQAAEAK
jgi:hypothetical protein